MGTKVAAFVAVMGATAAGTASAEAQIADAARAGRASGQIHAPGRHDRDCRDLDRAHRWEDGWRIADCEAGHASGWALGHRDARRDDRWDDRWDDRRNSRRDRVERWYRTDRAHRLLLGRLDRMHAEWHRRHGWTARDRRRIQDHAALHRHLDRLHDDWHRHDRRRFDDD
jgi:hypothetical protein